MKIAIPGGGPSVTQISDGSGGYTAWDGSLTSLIAGERLPDSATNSHLSVVNECQMVMPLAATAFSTSVANDAYLIGINITTTLAGIVTIDGFYSADGVADSIIIPAGTLPQSFNYYGAVNTQGPLTVTIANGTDNSDVQVLWRPRV